MQPNAHGWVHGYYGTYHIKDKKPKYGVHLYMLNEHVTRHIDAEKEKFVAEIRKMLDTFAKTQKERLDKISNEIKATNQFISEVKRYVASVIETNELKQPEEKEKPKKAKKAKPKKEEEDMGYL